MVELVYSIDDSAYLAWQADLLDWSIRRVGMQCRITRLTMMAPDQHKYKALNMFWSLLHEWQPSEAETVVVLDPDMVLLKPLDVLAKKGVLLGHPYSYMYDLPWCPVVLPRENIREWAAKSLPLTRVLHANGVGWISEMWAGIIGASLMGLKIERKALAVFNSDLILGDAAMIHYCYESDGFYKQTYQAGQFVNPSGLSEPQRALATLINQFFAEKRK